MDKWYFWILKSLLVIIGRGGVIVETLYQIIKLSETLQIFPETNNHFIYVLGLNILSKFLAYSSKKYLVSIVVTKLLFNHQCLFVCLFVRFRGKYDFLSCKLRQRYIFFCVKQIPITYEHLFCKYFAIGLSVRLHKVEM